MWESSLRLKVGREEYLEQKALKLSRVLGSLYLPFPERLWVDLTWYESHRGAWKQKRKLHLSLDLVNLQCWNAWDQLLSQKRLQCLPRHFFPPVYKASCYKCRGKNFNIKRYNNGIHFQNVTGLACTNLTVSFLTSGTVCDPCELRGIIYGHHHLHNWKPD